MSIRKPEDNLWFHIYHLVTGFFCSLWDTIVQIFTSLFWKNNRVHSSPNHFLASLHFLVHEFPKNFWKHPTGLGIGRSIGTFFLYFFGKNKYFNENEENTSKKTSIQPSWKWNKVHQKGFTLIELILSITLFSGILIAAFSSFGNIWLLKNKVLSDVDIYEQLYVATENLSSIIKDWGDIDYEEYFNRSLVGTTLSGWHYAIPSGFGNFWEGGVISGTPFFGSGTYLCRSGSPTQVVTDAGCALTWALNSAWNSQLWSMQRFGEYRLQFWDYNGGGSNDTTYCNGKWKPWMQLWDQDCNGKISGDLDDEELALGPAVFPVNSPVSELYLIKKSSSNPTRLILRLKIERDPDAPTSAPCDTWAGTGSGCIGRLQMLKLIGRDLWINHAASSTPVYDGSIDTWECAPEFPCTLISWGTLWWIQRYLPSGDDSEWVDVFSKDINVVSALFYPSPNIDYSLAWKDNSDSLSNSYLRIHMKLGYSWKKRKLIQFQAPEVEITTSLNLRK